MKHLTSIHLHWSTIALRQEKWLILLSFFFSAGGTFWQLPLVQRFSNQSHTLHDNSTKWSLFYVWSSLYYKNQRGGKNACSLQISRQDVTVSSMEAGTCVGDKKDHHHVHCSHKNYTQRHLCGNVISSEQLGDEEMWVFDKSREVSP